MKLALLVGMFARLLLTINVDSFRVWLPPYAVSERVRHFSNCESMEIEWARKSNGPKGGSEVIWSGDWRRDFDAL